MTKQNVTRDRSVEWNRYAQGSPQEALKSVYDHVQVESAKLREWYWSSIHGKKRKSISVRVISYLFAVAGVLAPLTAAMASKADQKLILTQAGVIALVIAGLAQLSDRVFGWSSGWQRYVTTVTSMERLTTQFELDWASCLLARGTHVDWADVVEPFELAKAFVFEFERLRGVETDAWVVEFNAGLAALNEMVKLRRDASPTGTPTASVTAVATATAAAAAPAPGTAPAPAPATVTVRGIGAVGTPAGKSLP